MYPKEVHRLNFGEEIIAQAMMGRVSIFLPHSVPFKLTFALSRDWDGSHRVAPVPSMSSNLLGYISFELLDKFLLPGL